MCPGNVEAFFGEESRDAVLAEEFFIVDLGASQEGAELEAVGVIDAWFLNMAVRQDIFVGCRGVHEEYTRSIFGIPEVFGKPAVEVSATSASLKLSCTESRELVTPCSVVLQAKRSSLSNSFLLIQGQIYS